MIRRWRYRRRLDMAAQTFLVVSRGIGRQRLMRVVAGGTGKTSVTFPPASALLQAIGGKADDIDSLISQFRHVPPSAMARTAKVHGSGRIQVRRIEDQSWICAHTGVGQGDMSGTGPVTTLARDSWDPGRRIELTAGYGSGGMTTEALREFLAGDRSAESVGERLRNGAGFPGGDAGTKSLENRHPGFPPLSSTVVDESLPVMTAAEDPRQWNREGLSVVVHFVDKRLVFGTDGVDSRAN